MPSSHRSSQKKDTDKGTLDADTLPPSLRPLTDTPPIHTDAGSFDIDEPELPDWVAKHALASGGYPYSDPMDKKRYERETKGLQVELVKLQKHVGQSGLRIVVVFEGRDAAGKGGTIATFRRYLNPRGARLVALAKPTEAERTQWFFQRYIGHLPIAGEMVLFDRSWYNRAGVEPVMGFCTPEEHRIFLDQAPVIEASFAEQGIILFKFWLDIGREMQLKRFHSRRHDPLKVWKLSPIDYEAMLRWDAYSEARDRMLAETHTLAAPWTVVRANDKRRARLSVMRHVLARLDYPGRDGGLVDDIDPAVIGSGPDFLAAGR